jgi:hypothetical protein
MNYQDLLKKAESHVNGIYKDHADANLFYHNQSHAMDILEKTKKIAAHYYLDEHNTFITCAAACFSDASQLIKNGKTQKAGSAKLARAFFSNSALDETDIVAIEKCILATEIPQNPETLAEKILCDAVLYYLGTAGFMEENALLRRETEAVSNTKIDDNIWITATINLLENHRYHTGYGQLLLDKGKAANLELLRNLQKKAKNVKAAIALPDAAGEDLVTELELDNLASDEPKKKNRPSRGIETMFRIVASKNIKISEMADGKANIMISINSIIISVILGLMAGTLRENQNLIIPTVILLVVNVGTIIFSVLATRPKIPNGRFTPEDVSNRSVNLLYFGSFYKMNFKEFNEGLKEMMDDSDFLYGTLSKDTFWQGKVLGRKFRLLRISYTIFLYGIVASVLAFMAAFIFY